MDTCNKIRKDEISFINLNYNSSISVPTFISDIFYSFKKKVLLALLNFL